MLHKVSNKLSEIKSTIEIIKNNNKETAFISYIEGEYGMRVAIYNSDVINFVKTIKSKNNETIIIGICFINHTFFLKEICDHIIEIQDTKFEDSEHIISGDIHNPNFLSNNYYSGNDGWSNYYIRGIHSSDYENMLSDINFSNIFFTSHCDGSTFVNSESSSKREFNYKAIKIVGKINNEYYESSLSDLSKKNILIESKSNDIALHIRNTTKWPERNLPKEIYEPLFEYCIQNQKKLHVFLDLIHVETPDSEYICLHNDRINNIPNLDYYIDVISNCNTFIGTDSGFSEMVSYYTTTPNIFIYNKLNWLINPNRNVNLYYTYDDLINLLSNSL